MKATISMKTTPNRMQLIQMKMNADNMVPFNLYQFKSICGCLAHGNVMKC